MPELPEVETLRRGLTPFVRGRRIEDIQVLTPSVLNVRPIRLKKLVVGRTVTTLVRRGKMLWFSLSDRSVLAFHLKMTGQLLWVHRTNRFAGGKPLPFPERLPNRWTRVIFRFSGGTLYFNDMRRFGFVRVYSERAFASWFESLALGPEPIDPFFSSTQFADALSRHQRTTIKSALLNQRVVAGVGNIYADESLFAARLLPTRRVNQLSRDEIRRLSKALRLVLTTALDAGGTSFATFRSATGKKGRYWRTRRVYGRVGLACPRCRTRVRKISCAGRGTHFCPQCQS